MKVWVDAPVVSGDRVLFRWRQSEPNPFQRVNEFFVRYEGINLEQFSNQLFYEIFLAFQLRVFAGYRKPIELVFPEPISSRSADFWIAFHPAELVTVGPLADIERYEPTIGAGDPNFPTKKAAIFYGGGKDSVLATGILCEIFGADQVLLIQYVASLSYSTKAMEMHEQRQEELMLSPMRAARGVATQRVFTDYKSIFLETGIALRPHLQFFTAGALPVLLAHGVEYSTFGANRTDFPILVREDGTREYVFERSRPEVLAAQSTHYQRVLGFNHQVTNLNFPFTPPMAASLLHARYPELLPVAVMCAKGKPGERWCYRCSKCLGWALYTLATGDIDDRFDYDRIFAEAPATLSFTESARTGVELSHYGNAPWHAGLPGSTSFYQSACHALAKCDPKRLQGMIGLLAMSNLYSLVALYGNTRFADHETIATEVLKFTGVDLLQRVGTLAGEHLPTVERMQGPWLHGDRESLIDFQTRMPTPLAQLPHLRGGT